MRRRLILLLLAAALAPGCAALPPPARPAPRIEAGAVLALAASQVQRCYRSPRVSFEGRQIVTRLRVRFTGDGQLVQLPVVIDQSGLTPRNRPYAGRMAQAAIAAVLRCAPLRLPDGLSAAHAFAFDMTFSPLAPA